MKTSRRPTPEVPLLGAPVPSPASTPVGVHIRSTPLALLSLLSLSSLLSFSPAVAVPPDFREQLVRNAGGAIPAQRSSRASVVTPAAGYRSTTINIPGFFPAGPIAEDPNDPTAFLVTVAPAPFGFQNQTIVRVRLDYTGGVTSLAGVDTLITGTVNAAGSTANGNNVLDNLMGSTSIAMRADGSAVVVDNDEGGNGVAAGTLGEAVLEFTDISADNDFRDISGGNAEVTVYATPIATPGGNFSGAAITLDSAGTAYIATNDGSAAGEILRIEDGGSTQTVFASGLDFGSGVDLEVGGNGVYFADTSFVDGVVIRAEDLSVAPDGDALDGGEQTPIATLDTVADLAVNNATSLFVTTNFFGGTNAFKVEQVALPGGTITELADFAESAPFAQFMQGLAFDTSANTFAPFSATPSTPGRRLAVIDSENGLNILEPELASAGVDYWQLY